MKRKNGQFRSPCCSRKPHRVLGAAGVSVIALIAWLPLPWSDYATYYALTTAAPACFHECFAVWALASPRLFPAQMFARCLNLQITHQGNCPDSFWAALRFHYPLTVPGGLLTAQRKCSIKRRCQYTFIYIHTCIYNYMCLHDKYSICIHFLSALNCSPLTDSLFPCF